MTVERSLLALQDAILVALTQDMPLSGVMNRLCYEVERLAPEVRCAVIRLEGQLMRLLAAPGMPGSYGAALDGFAIDPHTGTCGASMTYGRSVMTDDIATDQNWVALKHLLLPLGLGACWSNPIKARDGKVLGCLDFYYQSGERPSEFHQLLAEDCLSLCSLAFEFEATHQSLQRHASFDELTGLPNRAMLGREVERLLAECGRDKTKFSLFFIDIDNLKPINDSYGHIVGDAVLCRAAELFRSAVRGEDFVGRLGGDEFLAVVRHKDKADVRELVARLSRLFEQPLDLAHVCSEQITIGVSIGVATYPDDGEQVETLLDRADTAMYQAKEAGRNRVQFFSDPDSGEAGQRPFRGDASAPPDEGKDGFSLYGDGAREVMAQFAPAIKAILRDTVNRFFEKLSLVSGAGSLGNNLSAAEMTRLKSSMADHIMSVCSPDLELSRHEEIALQIGYVHAQIGLTRDALAQGINILNTLISGSVDKSRHLRALMVFGQRMSNDLVWQLFAAQEMQLLYNSALAKLTEAAWKTRSYTEFITSAVQIIASIRGIAGCLILRPDDQRVFHIEALAGRDMEALYGEIATKHGELAVHYSSTPTGRAWFSLAIERCYNYAADERVAAWRTLLSKWGIRSTLAIPLVAPKVQAASAVVVVHCRLPGAFSSQEQDMFLAQVQSLMVFGVSRLQAWQVASTAIPFTTRERWMSLLRTGGLEMYYQPIMSLKTGKITKVEALARLHDGDRTLAPGTFFPVMFHKDFLLLYENGLEQALRQREKWAGDGWELDMSVNLPNAALENDFYIGLTARLMQRYSCPQSALTLEILEAEEVSREVDLVQVLRRYREIGVRLAEDDLGAGYSTLARMREMSFDVIKIDRSILVQVDSDPYNTLCFIYQLARLGRSLGGTVVVEGVETTDLLEACVILGVDYAQGYVVARPLPASQIGAEIGLPPTQASPDNPLALLAHVLVWEERREVIAAAAEKFGLQRDEILSRLLENVLPEGSNFSPEVHETIVELVACAAKSGLRSAEYVQARDRLIAVASFRDWRFSRMGGSGK